MSFSAAIKDGTPPVPDFLRRDVISRKIAVEPPEPEDAAEPPEHPLDAVTKLVEATVDELEKRGVIKRPENAIGSNRLNEIASLVNSLTYGEMIELGEAICTANAGIEITQEALPAALHRWSMSR